MEIENLFKNYSNHLHCRLADMLILHLTSARSKYGIWCLENAERRSQDTPPRCLILPSTVTGAVRSQPRAQHSRSGTWKLGSVYGRSRAIGPASVHYLSFWMAGRRYQGLTIPRSGFGIWKLENACGSSKAIVPPSSP